MSDYIPIKQAAFECGKSRQALMKKIDAGQIKSKKKGSRWYISKQSLVNHFSGKIFNGQPDSDKGETKKVINDNYDDPKSYSTSLKVDIALKVARLNKIKLETKIQEGKYIDAEKANKQFYDTGRQIRDNLLVIPGRIADKCFNQTKHEIEQIIEREIKTALFSVIGES